jgi:hypothetical protein
MPNTCFSYPAGLNSSEPRRMPAMCFTYTAEAPRSMPFSCFSYSVERRAIPDLRRMPTGTCFRY